MKEESYFSVLHYFCTHLVSMCAQDCAESGKVSLKDWGKLAGVQIQMGSQIMPCPLLSIEQL